MEKEKVCLAYSGGLDTSCILKWLLEKNYEVVCFMADVGQEEDFQAAKDKVRKFSSRFCDCDCDVPFSRQSKLVPPKWL